MLHSPEGRLQLLRARLERPCAVHPRFSLPPSPAFVREPSVALGGDTLE